MRRQFDILDEVAQFMFNAAADEFERLVLEVEVDVEEGSTSYQCWQTAEGKTLCLLLDFEDGCELMNPSFELYHEMKKHTGGELQTYSITIDEEGTARCKFAYGNEPPQPS